jgi:hypothetical protein
VVYKFPLPEGPIEVLHDFDPATGRHPTGQLLPLGDWLYGTASDLFEHDKGYYGTLYRIHKTTGLFELLHAFDDITEGSHPYDELYYDGSDRLIGTTFGQAFNPDSKGTIFSYSIANDTLTILHDFGKEPGTGSKPNGGLIKVDASGFIYGSTHGSNAVGGEKGTLFRIREEGSDFTLLHRFGEGLSGNTPMRNLTSLNGNLFGVTAFGGLTTNSGNPETGPGMIFKYEPLASPSAARTSYIEWLRDQKLLVNQREDADTDEDSLSLIEEFAFGGDPNQQDSPQSFSFTLETGNPTALFPTVRSEMLPFVTPFSSVDLKEWSPDTANSVEIFDHPSMGAPFKSMTLTWPANLPESGALFIRFNTSVPD